MTNIDRRIFDCRLLMYLMLFTLMFDTACLNQIPNQLPQMESVDDDEHLEMADKRTIKQIPESRFYQKRSLSQQVDSNVADMNVEGKISNKRLFPRLRSNERYTVEEETIEEQSPQQESNGGQGGSSSRPENPPAGKKSRSLDIQKSNSKWKYVLGSVGSVILVVGVAYVVLIVMNPKQNLVQNGANTNTTESDSKDTILKDEAKDKDLTVRSD